LRLYASSHEGSDKIYSHLLRLEKGAAAAGREAVGFLEDLGEVVGVVEAGSVRAALFNRRLHIGEANNVIDQHPEIAGRLAKVLKSNPNKRVRSEK